MLLHLKIRKTCARNLVTREQRKAKSVLKKTKDKQNVFLLPSSALNSSFSWAEMVFNLDFHPTHPSTKSGKYQNGQISYL